MTLSVPRMLGWMMKWKGFGRKLSWVNRRVIAEGQSKTMETRNHDSRFLGWAPYEYECRTLPLRTPARYVGNVCLYVHYFVITTPVPSNMKIHQWPRPKESETLKTFGSQRKERKIAEKTDAVVYQFLVWMLFRPWAMLISLGEEARCTGCLKKLYNFGRVYKFIQRTQRQRFELS
jgi:hypothetical protein